MNSKSVIEELQHRYPNKKIVPNDRNNPTEIICEIEPASDHPQWSKAIAVIEQSRPHLHVKTTETYTVIKGTLTITVNGEDHIVPEGQSYIINPPDPHSARGDSVWVECESIPGWNPQDHILIEK